MSNWKDKSYLAPPFHVLTIGPEGDKTEMKFYAVTVSTAFKLREIAGDLGKGLASFFGSMESKANTKQEIIEDGEGSSQRKIESTPNIELEQYRIEEQKKAIQNLLTLFMSDEARTVLGLIIISSLRDEFPPGASDNPEPMEYVDALPATLLPQMLMGVMLANKEVFGPLAKRGEEAFDQLKELLDQKMKKLEKMTIQAKENVEDGGEEGTQSQETDPAEQTPEQ